MLSPDEWRDFFQLLQRVSPPRMIARLRRSSQLACQTQNNTLLAINIIDTVIVDDEGDILCWLFTGKVLSLHKLAAAALTQRWARSQEGKVLKKNADKRTVRTPRTTPPF